MPVVSIPPIYLPLVSFLTSGDADGEWSGVAGAELVVGALSGLQAVRMPAKTPNEVSLPKSRLENYEIS